MGLNKVWLVFTVMEDESPDLRSVHQTKEGAVSHAKDNYILKTAIQTSELCWRNWSDTVFVSQEDVQP
jgi:hypothetical protein